MTILIDPPTWPAHGTLFSHLVSDNSYTELHRFARQQSLSERAFDLDHYDVPAELYDRLVGAGATPVSGRELTRRLIASGLRVPLKERSEKIRNTLLHRWNSILPNHLELGEHILDQWSIPTRYYHNGAHLLEMLVALDLLYFPAQPPRVVHLATWLHDVIYRGNSGQDERDSAEFARDVLTPLIAQKIIKDSDVEDTAALIKATIHHSVEDISLSQVTIEDAKRFLDADMAILAAPTPRYLRYSQAIRVEYGHFSDAEFRAGRAAVLENFLNQKELYLSEEGKAQWEKKARENLQAELNKLQTSA